MKRRCSKPEVPASPIPAEIQKMIENQGIYIGYDPAMPGVEVPILSYGGKLYSMRFDQELDPTRFIAETKFSGPFRSGD
jgi:hypothetical protein